ncbi:MAG: glycosyltransferase family 4 protein [Bacteroidota bacterium]
MTLKPNNSTRILFTSSLATSFIKEDLSLLHKHFIVDHVIARGLLSPFTILRYMWKADVTFTWFASVYGFMTVFLARLLGKRSIVVIGGVDASKEPVINYGIWLTPWKAVLVKWTMRNAWKLLVVDPFFIGEVKRLAGYDGRNVEYLPTGYDAARWVPSGEKENFVLTVAACHDEWRMKKKGLDVLFAAAKKMEGTKFIVLGILPHVLEQVKATVPANVELIPFVQQDQLLAMYRKAKVYCQPSFTEGLPNSLCEAMLCECIPVGTNVGGIPTAIADIGFLVPYGDADALATALTNALSAGREVGAHAREHIRTNFTIERRETGLVRTINEAVK